MYWVSDLRLVEKRRQSFLGQRPEVKKVYGVVFGLILALSARIRAQSFK